MMRGKVSFSEVRLCGKLCVNFHLQLLWLFENHKITKVRKSGL